MSQDKTLESEKERLHRKRRRKEHPYFKTRKNLEKPSEFGTVSAPLSGKSLPSSPLSQSTIILHPQTRDLGSSPNHNLPNLAEDSLSTTTSTYTGNQQSDLFIPAYENPEFVQGWLSLAHCPACRVSDVSTRCGILVVDINDPFTKGFWADVLFLVHRLGLYMYLAYIRFINVFSSGLES